jgi:putative ABC transport system substrate-binding protein
MKRRTFIGLVAGSLAARSAPSTAQAGKPARIGLLLLGPFPGLTDPFFATLRERGWSVGKNLQVETRVTAAEQTRAADMAREMIGKGANIIGVTGTANAIAAREASKSVPIVMLAAGYPVQSGLAASLARPGGNVTGVSVYAGTELFGKFVALFKEAVPKLEQLGIFWGYAPPAFPRIEVDIAVGEIGRAASALGIRTRFWMNPDLPALERTLAEAEAASLDALFVSAGGAQSAPDGIAKVAAFCERRRLPTMCDVTGNFFAAGGVLSYSVDFRELGVRGAGYVDRILRGAKPGDLPIEQPTRFELVLNLKRAKQIGMAVPPALLARADRVIE